MPKPTPRPPPRRPDETRPCEVCGETMAWTGQPSFSGPVRFRFFRCPTCGVRKVDVDPERFDGWG